MNKVVWTIGAAIAALVGGTAQAQPALYGGGYLPPPPYAVAGYDYGEVKCKRPSFKLLGARAGVTVLGLDADASAGLRIGAGERCRRTVTYAPRPYAPAPTSPQTGYGAPYGAPSYQPHYRW